MRPIGLDQQDVGPSGVATGRGAFHFRSSSSVGGMKKTPTDGSFTLFNEAGHRIEFYLNHTKKQRTVCS
ncbi:hypothetical protein [Rummeliibacillus suwonensis]|uniref:hypothetical protein n=1 Tax=Rummeliibacillus suwonensis TaxID=1306154 RepID=UPI001AAE67AA|nr:hypothetical protein [Rummeliibacillus suwonensis]MBO2537434.1 hypothetical protein [Rummeliibacillus suwonensis]